MFAEAGPVLVMWAFGLGTALGVVLGLALRAVRG